MGAYAGPKIAFDSVITAHDATINKQGTTRFVTDLSGQGRDCQILNGAAYDAGQDAIYHDGNNDMTVNYNVRSNECAWTPGGAKGVITQTLEMWVKTSDGSGRLYTKPWNGSGRYNVWMYPTGFYLLVGTGVSSGPDTSSSLGFSESIADGNWHQLVCWMNSTTMGYSIDGNRVTGQKTHGLPNYASDYGDANLPQGYMTLYPYGNGWGGNTGFGIQGNLAIFRHYSRVLSAEEIQRNFVALRGRFGL